MASDFAHRYDPDIEDRMRALLETLGEKARRRDAAREALKLPRDGIQSLADLFGCSRRTIERGLEERDQRPEDPAAGRQRRPGGGRKKAEEENPELEDNLFQVLEFRLAGGPEDPLELWTDLEFPQIASELDALGTPISPPPLENRLGEFGVSRRKIANARPGGHSPDRNEQFEHIARLREQFAQTGDPVFSVDTKAKESLGFGDREGRRWCPQPQRAFDHDDSSWADGVLIPHGLFDLQRNPGHLNLGVSHDTSQFACESFRWSGKRIARRHDPQPHQMLWLCDAGGSHSYRHQIFKQDLEDLAEEMGLAIRGAHDPSYCSKYNPIERRFFPHVARACRGLLLKTLETAVRLMRKTSTKTGLTSSVHIIKKVYEKGRQVRDNFRETARLVYDSVLPRWNDTVLPPLIATVIFSSTLMAIRAFSRAKMA